MLLNWQIKRFNELSTLELYKILALRNEVFIVEQNCVYQDVDNKDLKAIHLFAIQNDEVVAYARIFDAGDYFDKCSIGRVITTPKYRNQKLGHILVQKSIEVIYDYFGKKTITISAQEHLKTFYEQHGFVQTSAMYLEDDIPHIEMEKAGVVDVFSYKKLIKI